MKKIKWQTIIFAWLSPVFWHKIWKILFTYLFISTSKASEKRPGDDVDLFIWELKQLYDDDHNYDFKKNQWSKQQLCTCIMVFSTDTFPWLPPHDYDVKPPDFTFYVGREHTTTNFPLSFWTWIKSLSIQLQEKWPAFDILSGSKQTILIRTQTLFYRRFHCRGRLPCLRFLLPSCMTSSSRTNEGEKTSTSGLACDYALISIMSTSKKKRLTAGYSSRW